MSVSSHSLRPFPTVNKMFFSIRVNSILIIIDVTKSSLCPGHFSVIHTNILYVLEQDWDQYGSFIASYRTESESLNLLR